MTVNFHVMHPPKKHEIPSLGCYSEADACDTGLAARHLYNMNTNYHHHATYCNVAYAHSTWEIKPRPSTSNYDSGKRTSNHSP